MVTPSQGPPLIHLRYFGPPWALDPRAATYGYTQNTEKVSLARLDSNAQVSSVFTGSFEPNYNGSDAFPSLAVDPVGNSYLSSVFQFVAYWDTAVVLAELSHPHTQFLARFRPGGALHWVKKVAFPTTTTLDQHQVQLDRQERPYWLFQLRDSLTLGTDMHVPLNNRSAVIMALDTSGAYRWSQMITSTDMVRVIFDVHADGQLYLTGNYRGKLTLGDRTLIPPDEQGFWGTWFAACLDSTGEVNWIIQGENPGPNSVAHGLDIESHPEGGCVVLVGGRDSVRFGPNKVVRIDSFPPGGSPAFSVLLRLRDCTPQITLEGPAAYCIGSAPAARLSTAALPGGQYQWWRDGQRISGAVDSSYLPAVPGRYRVEVTDSSGCQARSSWLRIQELPPPPAPVLDSSGLSCAGDTLWGPSGFARYHWSTGDTTPWLILPGSGSYQLQLGNEGCLGPVSAPLSLSLAPAPSAPAVERLAGDSLRSTLPGSRYRWLREGELLPDTTRQIAATATGAYRVQYFEAGCWSTWSVPYGYWPVSRLEPDAPTPLRLHPNPGRDHVQLQWPAKPGQAAKVQLYDPTGRLLQQWQLPPGQAEAGLALPDLPAGLYLFRVRTGEGSWQARWRRE